MTKQISHLLYRFGIVHKFLYKQTSCDGKKFDSWKIYITCQEYVNRFLQEINFISVKYREPKEDSPGRSYLDRFPEPIARQFYNELVDFYEKENITEPEVFGVGSYIREHHHFRRAFGTRKAGYIRERLALGKPIVRKSFETMDKNNPVYQKYMNSGILWDEIVSIKSVGERPVYDISVQDRHNYVANDFIVHNSVWLWDMAYRAVRNRYRVAYFDAGDMGRDAVMQRMGCRVAKPPMSSGVYKWPTHIDEDGTVHYKEKHYQEGLSPQKAFRAMKKLTRGKDLLRLSCYPNSSLDISMICTQLTDWAREGWVADSVVVDYADILADPPNCEDVKDRIDTTWKLLRRLSQEFHCLVLTATQSNAAAYSAGQGVLRRQHFSGRKTKLAHANAIIGLNVSAEDKDRGVTRLNYIVRREGAYNESRYVTAAGCLAIYCPVMKSK